MRSRGRQKPVQSVLNPPVRRSHRTIVLTGDIDTLVRLCDASDRITEVNLGGLHQSDGRTQRLPYVFLSNEEMEQLKQLSMRGIRIAAQDVPTARPVALEALL